VPPRFLPAPSAGKATPHLLQLGVLARNNLLQRGQRTVSMLYPVHGKLSIFNKGPGHLSPPAQRSSLLNKRAEAGIAKYG